MDKKGVILYFDQYQIIKGLSQSDKGTLLDAIFEYSINDNEIELSPVLEMAFSFIKNQIDRDKEKYLLKCEKNSSNGKKGAEKRWRTLSSNGENSERKRTMAKIADTDTDTDTDTDNIKKNSKKEILSFSDRQKSFHDSLIPFTELYGKSMIRAFYDYWSEPNKTMTKMKYELNKTWLLESRLRTWERRQNNGK